ncbi:hypothetical protein D3C80_1334050 [compost metagenome]
MRPSLQRHATAIEAHLGVELAAGDAKAQWCQAQHAILEDEVAGKIGERQLGTVHDALAAEGHVRVHGPPAFGAKFLDRQHLARGLLAGTASGFLLGIGVGPDQRRQVLEQQLVGNQLAAQLWPRLAGDERQVTMDIAVADLAVEAFIAKRRAARFMQFGREMTIGGIGR